VPQTAFSPVLREEDVSTWLASGEAFATKQPVERIDTHAASIFLNADRAWKIKRPVSLGYLDFSTVPQRKAALDAEFQFNRRTAPDLYLAVHPITRSSAGTLEIDGTGDLIDWVLEMRRFPSQARLDHALANPGVSDGVLRDLADSVLDFHREAEVNDRTGGAGRLRSVVEGNARSMACHPDILPPDRVAALTHTLLDAIILQGPMLDARGRGGRVRHCHGDLHLENIALIDGKAVPFDCLEFDTELATSDVLYDLAFLLMDLCERDRRHEANILFNRYLDRSSDDEAGAGLIRLFMAVRASVRAHVLAAQAVPGPQQAQLRHRALHYLALAIDLTRACPTRLVAIGGLSGTGKSTLARALGGSISGAPGARILRSDVLRKRLAGVEPEVRLAAGDYTQDASDRVYDEIGRLAGEALTRGQSVIADAVFAKPGERQAIAAVAQAARCAFDGLWLNVDTEERVRRVAARTLDASDADPGIARAQAAMNDQGSRRWGTLEAGGDFSLLQAAARIALNLDARSRSG
jgi:aminoglycoside phosphotransferase family enzyme/predicted kinase